MIQRCLGLPEDNRPLSEQAGDLGHARDCREQEGTVGEGGLSDRNNWVK
jgi:hypothetical protein